MSKRMNAGFSLMELIAVIIIIGVLATIGITQFSNSRERAVGKEAQANLRLIQTAEKIYKMEFGEYYPSSGSQGAESSINERLKLSLNTTNWDYSITGGANTFFASATRGTCTYSIGQDDSEPTAGPTCVK